MVVGLSGCSDLQQFFDKSQIERHSRDLIQEMSEIEPVPEAKGHEGELYETAPEVVSTPKGTFVFYRTKYQCPEQLSKLLMDNLDVKVTTNTKINQCVIKCESYEEAPLVIDFLAKTDVKPLQIQVDCLVSEVYADQTLDWETTLDIQDLFGSGDGTVRQVGDVVADAIEVSGTLPGASNREVTRSNMGLKVGMSSASGSFSAMIDLLESRGYMQVVMRPRLQVVNGETASIMSSDLTPITKTVTTQNVEPYDITEYQEVVDSLEITPNVYSDRSIGLKTKVMLGSTSTPVGVSQKTIITTREIEIAENLITPGKSLIIGGLRKTEKVGITRGVPVLKDIPILGILFSSKDYETSANEVLFILTPTISDTGRDHRKTIAAIRKRHAEKELPGLLDGISGTCSGSDDQEAAQTQCPCTAEE